MIGMKNRNITAVIIGTYLLMTIIRWHVQYWTGRALIWLGYFLRDWINPEFGHTAFINLIRWTYWQPAWVWRIQQGKLAWNLMK
jgi:hypothetical protein